MGVNKATLNTPDGEEVVFDISRDTVTSETLFAGETAHGADGEKITGTLKPVLYAPQTLTEEEKAQARENIGAADAEAVVEISSITEIVPKNNIIELSEESFWSQQNLPYTLTFVDDGFEFIRGQQANYPIGFLFDTEAGKSYDLSLNFESGIVQTGTFKIADNYRYPDRPVGIPGDAIYLFTDENGIKTCSFTANGKETVLFMSVAWNSDMAKVSSLRCVESGSDYEIKVKKNAIPFNSFNAVVYSEQTLTEAAKAQARKNIGVTDIPKVTSSDDGKFLRVVDGVWAAVTIDSAEGVSF